LLALDKQTNKIDAMDSFGFQDFQNIELQNKFRLQIQDFSRFFAAKWTPPTEKGSFS